MERASRWCLIAEGNVQGPHLLKEGLQPLLSAPDTPLAPRGSLGYQGLTSRAQEKGQGGCQEGMGLCSYLNHRKGTALAQPTRSCTSRDRKSAEYRAGSCLGEGLGHLGGQLGLCCSCRRAQEA